MARIMLYVSCLFAVALAKTLDLDGDVAKLSESNVQFSIDLYKKLIADPSTENIMFSPVSVAAAMAMTHLGAKGDTANQIDEVFRFNKLEGKFHSAFGELHGLLLDKTAENVTIKSSNRVFANDQLKVLEDYKNALTVYGAQVDSLDFAKNPEKSVESINNWISEKTDGKIPSMLAKDSVDGNTALVIANALYFRGNWHSKFSEQQTEQRAFYVSHYTVVKTPFMFQRGKFRYGYVEELTLQIVELPYAGKEYSMYVLLPENFDLKKVEANLNPENLTRWISEIGYRTVDITLPKFKLEESLNLHEVLPKLGVTDVFDQSKADLSGLAKKPNLNVDQILHKAVLEVNEEGSVAAAATTVRIVARSLDIRPEFVANHPFLWAIRHEGTGLVLFMGRLQRPEGPLMNHDEF
uniref:Leukocyte elastase inhibitor-like n=1 Tax=Phallusia mammillata TaxID=59560 RepID=A0A6F9DSK4_9ASCI|nr:leukocyte elastase inhibitor-like [Phallusia mammillata]